MGIVDRYYQGAGGSASRRYKALARDWRSRMFGARTPIYVWSLYILGFPAVLLWTPQHRRFPAAFILGMLAMALWIQ